MTKKYWMATLPGLVSGLLSCSGEGLDPTVDVGRSEQDLTLMAKPGSQAATFTEAGRDIEQVGAYTFYSADADANVAGGYQGSVHLFKNSAPFRSYQARTVVPGSRMGYRAALSENWAVTDLVRFPVAPGRIEDAILLIGKSGGDFASCGSIAADGTLPNCVTCTGAYSSDEANSTLACTASAPGVQIVTAPAGSSFSSALFELEGNELLVGTRDGGSEIVQLRHNGSQWLFQPPIPAPAIGEAFGKSMAISGNVLAVGATGSNGLGHVYLYERLNATSPWQLRLRVNPPAGDTTGFGSSLDLSGSSLLVGDNNNVHFIQLDTQNLSSPSAALTESCSVFNVDNTPDVAISGTRAVVTTQQMPITFSRGSRWAFYGGLPSAIFPHDGEGVVDSTAYSLWGAAIDGSRVAIGWRNYRGSNPNTETGAALGFTFEDYDCGTQMGVAGAGWVRAKRLTIPSVSAPNYSAYPETLAIDGNAATRWMAPASGGTRFEIDFGQLRVLSHLELDWGNRYANDYLLEVSDDPDSVPASQRTWRWLHHVTGGDGATDQVNLRGKAESFGRRLRVSMNGFGTVPGQTDQGVSIKELRVYGMVHDSCSNKPTVDCSVPATAESPGNIHVCANACGGQAPGFSCFCDATCVTFGDCCSPDGSAQGAQYFDAVLDACPNIGQ